MTKTLTQAWLLERLGLLNAKEIERRAGLGHNRFSDVKRGKAKLSEDELERINEVIKEIQL